VPLPLPNIDTDQIHPEAVPQAHRGVQATKTSSSSTGRYDLDTADVVKPRPEFVLNNPAYKAHRSSSPKRTSAAAPHANTLMGDQSYGFLAVIAPTFADIFFSNAGKNGIILVRLTEEEVQTLLLAPRRIRNTNSPSTSKRRPSPTNKASTLTSISIRSASTAC